MRRNLEEHPVDGIFTTGGDVTAALLAELGSHGLEISDEVVPLAVAGTVVGGPWDGLPVVTKGGLVGDADTTVACLDHLRRTRRPAPAPGVRRRVPQRSTAIPIHTPGAHPATTENHHDPPRARPHPR